MSRWLSRLLIALLLLTPAAPAAAQQPTPTPANPAAAPAPEPTGGGSARNTSLDFVVAFAGVALVLTIVCYPARRY